MGGLGFLVPAFLAGLTALLVPIVLHLRHRERDQPRRFPSLMFLRRIPIRTASRRRITDWLLLLLRAAAVFLLVAAFSRPFLGRTATETAAAPARAVVLLLDRSLSMGHTAVWPAALDSARAIIAGLAPADRIAVVLFDDEAEVAQPLGSDHGAALAAVNAAHPSSRGTRYAAALRAARQILGGARGLVGEVLVVTDMQRSGLAGLAGLELPADLGVRSVPVSPAKRPNAALVGAEIQRVPDGERSRLLVAARVLSRDLGAPRRTRLELSVNGRVAASREVTLPADGATMVTFDGVPMTAGQARATVALPADPLVADDTLRLLVPAEDALQVLVLAASGAREEETLFLERALAIGRDPRFAVQRRTGATLSTATLRDAAVVFLADTPVPGGSGGAALAAWVEAGGGLVEAAGRRLGARPPGLSILPGRITGTVERMEDRGGAFGEVSLDHEVFAPFRAGAAAALGAARFLSYPRIEPGEGAEVIARFDDGAPALIEKPRGQGRVLLLGAPLDAVTGDFPLQPGYLPFLRRLAVYASGHEARPPWRIAGESGLIPGSARDPVVSTPSGALLRPGADSAGRALALSEAGFYDVYEGRAAGEPVETFAVNTPPGESDLTPADARELLLGVRRGDSAQTVAAEPPAPREREGRQRIWRLLLGAVLLVLLVETVIANRGWRGTAATGLIPSSERSLS
ncbi:MAG TPA: BatA domain-containing protein [Gemmatimonadales bacterium]|nr:BatA domain-containing protein [Gemmatimonadales bacterium]